MSLRELLAAARAAGWHHIVYTGSFGREHVWRHGDTSVHLEHMSGRDGSVYTELSIVKDGQSIGGGRVDTVNQAAHLLAAYDLVDCPCRIHLMRTLDDLATIRQAGGEALAASHRRLLALHAHDGDPLGGGA